MGIRGSTRLMSCGLCRSRARWNGSLLHGPGTGAASFVSQPRLGERTLNTEAGSPSCLVGGSPQRQRPRGLASASCPSLAWPPWRLTLCSPELVAHRTDVGARGALPGASPTLVQPGAQHIHHLHMCLHQQHSTPQCYAHSLVHQARGAHAVRKECATAGHRSRARSRDEPAALVAKQPSLAAQGRLRLPTWRMACTMETDCTMTATCSGVDPGTRWSSPM